MATLKSFSQITF